jgi:restriction endonuclease Mrr
MDLIIRPVIGTGRTEQTGEWAEGDTVDQREPRSLADVAARVILVDGITLAQLMVTHNIGVQDRETHMIKRVDEDFFKET